MSYDKAKSNKELARAAKCASQFNQKQCEYKKGPQNRLYQSAPRL
jgi:hypothetical protein